MKLRYTLIGVLCFSINIVLQAQQQALEGKIAGFLKGKKATVGVAVLTDKDETILHNNEVHYPLLSVFKFHVALAVLDKMDREEIPLKHIVHVKASQIPTVRCGKSIPVKIWIYHWESFYNTASR